MIKISTKGQGTESTNVQFCPYLILRNYISLRPKYSNKAELFFIFRDALPITTSHMRTTLHLLLKSMGYQEDLYNCHSFRTGRSCDLFRFGMTVDNIKRLGRWKLNVVHAYFKYGI